MSQQETKDQILDLARGYLQRLGFNGFSFQTIADALGIRKASIHYHFKSKEEMGLALLENYTDSFKQWAERKSVEPKAAVRLEGFFRIFERFADDESKVCPIGVLSSDFHTLPKKMRAKLGEFYEMQNTWLIATLKAGKTSGEFSADINEAETADTIISAIQGGLFASRVRGDSGPLKNLKKFVFKSVVSESSSRARQKK